MSSTYKAIEYEVTKHHKTDTGNDLWDLDYFSFILIEF